MPSSLLCGAALTALSAIGSFAYNTDDQVDPNIPYGTFDNPSVHVRLRFRYWIPDASVNLTVDRCIGNPIPESQSDMH